MMGQKINKKKIVYYVFLLLFSAIIRQNPRPVSKRGNAC